LGSSHFAFWVKSFRLTRSISILQGRDFHVELQCSPIIRLGARCSRNTLTPKADMKVLLCTLLTLAPRVQTAFPDSDVLIQKVKKDLVMSSVHEVDNSQVPPWGYAFEIPTGITHVSINIGPNRTPIKVDGKDNLLILVDPLPSVVAYLRQHFAGPHVLVYEAAISNYSGTAVFHEYGFRDGLSSSLSTPSASKKWNQDTSAITVQVHTLKELLDAIPSNLPISFLKTDMQGYDLTAIKSAGKALKRVKKIMSETYQDGKPSYANTLNEYNRDWLPYMKGMGYTMNIEQIPKGTRGYVGCTDSYVAEPDYHEMDCHWILSDSVD